MPDPLSTIFISSPISGATRVNQRECQFVNHYYTREAYRWIPCGGPPSGSSSARRSTCSKTPCSPVPARIGMVACGATIQTTHSPRNTQHSGLSPITPSSGSTCISQAHLKDSLPLRPSPWMSLTQQVSFPNRTPLKEPLIGSGVRKPMRAGSKRQKDHKLVLTQP